MHTRSLLLGFIVCLTGIAGAQPCTAQGGISVDMEGIAGVVASHQTGPGGHEYGWARRLMTAEANAAIAAAFDAGATESSSMTVTARRRTSPPTR